MPKTKINRRLNLQIPRSLVQQVAQELLFLGVDSRIVVIEEREIQTRNDFVRLVAGQYCDRFLRGYLQPMEFEEETTSLPYYLDRQSEGLWGNAIADGAATSYNHLVSCALHDYFERQDQTARVVAQRLEDCKRRLQNFNLQEWRGLLV